MAGPEDGNRDGDTSLHALTSELHMNPHASRRHTESNLLKNLNVLLYDFVSGSAAPPFKEEAAGLLSRSAAG